MKVKKVKKMNRKTDEALGRKLYYSPLYHWDSCVIAK